MFASALAVLFGFVLVALLIAILVFIFAVLRKP